jgi:ribonuclease P protein component
MLPRKHRLSADKDVTRVLRKGRAVFTNLVGVKAAPNDIGVVRTAVVVSTKVHKRATERNLIKRRIRAVLANLIPEIKAPVDIVIMAQNEAIGRKQADMGAALEYCFKKLGLLS